LENKLLYTTGLLRFLSKPVTFYAYWRNETAMDVALVFAGFFDWLHFWGWVSMKFTGNLLSPEEIYK